MQLQQAGPSAPSEAPPSVSGGSVPPEGVQPQTAVPTEYEEPTHDYNDLRSKVEAEKEIYRQKKLMRQRELELEQREQQLNRPKSVDDLIDDILNNKEDRQEEPEYSKEHWSEEDIIARAKQEIYEELEQGREEYEHEMATQESHEQFSHEINNFIYEAADSFPLANELGLGNQIAQEMIEHLDSLADEYGQEYAEKWFHSIDWNEHIAYYENNLAENFKTMLKSDRVRNLLRSYLGEENYVPTGENPKTLSRGDFRSSSGSVKSLQEMTTDERVAYAKAQLRAQRQQDY
jgi:hypothetical protein